MRRLIFILLAMIGVSRAQTIQYIGAPTTTVISRGNFRTDSIFYLPKRSKAPTDTAAFRYQISDSSLYVWTGSQWIKAGGSGTLTGSGIAGYLPQFSASTILDTSALFTLGNRLGIGTSTFAYNSTNTANMELNGTAGGILGFKRNDSARGYLWHTGDNMELANTAAGSISFNTNSATRGSISSAGVWRLHNLAGTGDRVVVASSNGTLSASTSVTGLVDTTTISTRAWRQKGLDSLAALEVSGSGTTNYIPKFTASSTIGNSQIFDNGTNVGIGTASPVMKFETRDGDIGVSTLNTFSHFLANRNTIPSGAGTSLTGIKFRAYSTGTTYVDGAQILAFSDGAWSSTSAPTYLSFQTTATSSTSPTERLRITSGGDVGIGTISPSEKLDVSGFIRTTSGVKVTDGTIDFRLSWASGNVGFFGNISNHPIDFYTNAAQRMRIFANGRVGINTTTDAGYQLDINGTLRSVNGANFATTSGNVGIGTASPQQILHANATTGAYIQLSRTAQGGTTSPFGGIYFGDGTTFQEAAILSGADGNVVSGNMAFYTRAAAGSLLEGFRVNSTQEMLVGGGADAGDYKLQVSGNVLATDVAGSYPRFVSQVGTKYWEMGYRSGTTNFEIREDGTTRFIIDNGGEVFINTDSDAGDYKLQVVGNARVGTGKLDIASNTTFGIGVARSGTSEVAGQIYNSNGILYLGAESSAGGQIFSGSSAYAAVIGSGANYPLQFATNNATRATINTNGELLINTTTDNGDFKLQVNGNALISGSIKTANGTSSTAVPWHLGSVVATNVQLDTANYVEVEINGTFYRLAIVTPL